MSNTMNAIVANKYRNSSIFNGKFPCINHSVSNGLNFYYFLALYYVNITYAIGFINMNIWSAILVHYLSTNAKAKLHAQFSKYS
jgi:hypothetical protein